jgi:hypothetical protein
MMRAAIAKSNGKRWNRLCCDAFRRAYCTRATLTKRITQQRDMELALRGARRHLRL